MGIREGRRRGRCSSPIWIRPAGYPALLAGLHAIWGSLSLVIVLQHLMGLATAVLAYATMLRAGAPKWVALVPAAVLALTLDAIYYEHTLLSETPFTLLVSGALYCGVRALEPRAGIGWAVASGLLVGLATTFRGIALFVIPVFVVVLLLRDGGWRRNRPARPLRRPLRGPAPRRRGARRTARTGTSGSPGQRLVDVCARAPFADCRVFDAAAGDRGAVRSARRPHRPGPDWYAWDPDSPGQRAVQGPAERVRAGRRVRPRRDRGAAARVRQRGRDRHVALRGSRHRGRPRLNGDPPDALDLTTRSRSFEAHNLTQVEPLYGDVDIEVDGAVGALADVQSVVRVHGPLVLASLLLALAGLAFAAGRRAR